MQDSSYGVPIGTVIAWPFGSAPLGLHNDHWLECNGQAVTQAEYPRLYELLMKTTGKNLVPDYQGMFLRGLGKQTYSQYNGVGLGTSTTYRSGDLGATQGDSVRNIKALLGEQQLADFGANGYYYGESSNIFYLDPYRLGHRPEMAAFPLLSGDHNQIPYLASSQNFGEGWANALKKEHYKLNVSYGDAGGVHYVSGIDVETTEEYPELTMRNMSDYISMDLSLGTPTAEEIRPVNKAVRYMIKAK